MKGKYVGQSLLRIDSRDKVTGEAAYPGTSTWRSSS
jgi:hypothetical protein